MQPYSFATQHTQSLSRAEIARRWFSKRADVAEARDVQDNPHYFYRGDLMIVRKSGLIQYIELKCEAYTRRTTEHLAIKRFSDRDRRTPGGHWSSATDFYAHIYTGSLLVIMNRERLVSWLDSALQRDPRAFPYRTIPNVTWITEHFWSHVSAPVRRSAGIGANTRRGNERIPTHFSINEIHFKKDQAHETSHCNPLCYPLDDSRRRPRANGRSHTDPNGR